MTQSNPYSLVIHPDRRLRQKALPVTEFNAQIAQKAQAMFDLMYHYKGIGLASNQAGIAERIVVIDIPEDREKDQIPTGQLILINPEIIAQSEALSTYEEGCLSLPQQYAEVVRPAEIRYRWQDLNGQSHEADASGLLATCIQHEIDHLNGVLFIDHLSRLKRERIEKKLSKYLTQLRSEPKTNKKN